MLVWVKFGLSVLILFVVLILSLVINLNVFITLFFVTSGAISYKLWPWKEF